jgi:hypothetical protein
MNLPAIQAALIKVTGVFSYKRKEISRFTEIGYDTIPLSEQAAPAACEDIPAWRRMQADNTRRFYKDTYYREFASLMLTGDAEDDNMRALHRRRSFDLILFTGTRGEPRQTRVTCTAQELFLFQNETGILSLTFQPEKLDFQQISDMIHGLRSFDTRVSYLDEEYTLHAFISSTLMANLPLRGGNVQADDYSGSKFKIYSVISTVEPDDGSCYSRDNLVYEIGTGSRIGELSGNGYNAPSAQYYEALMANSIKVFRNYTGLALLDSFTIIGQDVYKAEEDNYYVHKTYNRVYFSIYVFNLYLRYNIFRFNAIFSEDPVKTRDEFQQFLNRYNFSHISFNFLPNIFYKKIHEALGIDDEVAQFEKRLIGLATHLQEEQEKRQATLLGIISLLTGLSSANDIIDLLEGGRNSLGLQSTVFYGLLLLLIILLAMPLLAYLFPTATRKLMKKYGKKAKRKVRK